MSWPRADRVSSAASGWIDRGGHVASLATNRSVAVQFAGLVTRLGLRDVSYGSADWGRLQAIVESTRLPNDGFICIIANRDSKLLCHPEMRNDPSLREMQHGDTVLHDHAGSASITERRASGGQIVGTAHVEGESHVIGGTPIPELGITVLAHQRNTGIERAVNELLALTLRLEILASVVLVIVSAVLTWLVVDRDEYRLAKANRDLERLVEKRSRALTRTQEAVIFGLARLADSRDEDTGQHLDRIQTYVKLLCRGLHQRDSSTPMPDAQLVVRAAALHDIGKVGVADAVLLKPGKLTADERLAMQQHTVIGAACLRAISRQLGEDDFLRTAIEIAESHHERWDGGGYPNGHAGDRIPIAARLVAVADVYDALTTPRVYKTAWTHDDAVEAIRAEAGLQFDPAVVSVFLDLANAFRDVSMAPRTPGARAEIGDAAARALEVDQSFQPGAALVAAADEGLLTSIMNARGDV